MFDDEKEKPDRRTFVKAMVVAGAAAMTAGTLASFRSVFPPPVVAKEGLATFLYFKPPGNLRPPDPENDLWFSARVGEVAKASDFTVWRGAPVLWRALLDEEGKVVTGTGLPAIILRVDPTFLEVEPVPGYLQGKYPEGFNPTTDNGLVILFDKCVHLCCNPGWRLEQIKGDWQVPWKMTPQGMDPVFCVCHGSQYDPTSIVWDYYPNKAVYYMGAKRVRGPATRALPAIPASVNDAGEVEGQFTYPQWYTHCD